MMAKKQEIHWHFVEGGKHYDKRGRPRTRKLDDDTSKPKRKYAKKGSRAVSKRVPGGQTKKSSPPPPSSPPPSLGLSSISPYSTSSLFSTSLSEHTKTSLLPSQLSPYATSAYTKDPKGGGPKGGDSSGHILHGIGDMGDDGGLGMLLNFIRAYRDGVWLMAPLHPNVLHLSNLQRLFHAPTSFEKRDPLPFCLNIALALGALICGEGQLAEDFISQAREHVGHLFDTTDPRVAQGLLALAHYERAVGKRDSHSTAYYATLAMSIAKQLGDGNLHIYVYSMYILATVPSTPPHEVDSLKSQLMDLQKLPRSSLLRIDDPSLSPDVIPARVTLHNIDFLHCAIHVIFTSLLTLRQEKDYQSFEAIGASMQNLEERLAQLQQSQDALPEYASTTIQLSILGIRAQVYWLLGMNQNSLLEARRFLSHSLTSFKYCNHEVTPVASLVLDIFLRSGQLEDFHSQLKLLDKMAGRFPVVHGLIQTFAEKLRHHHHTKSTTGGDDGLFEEGVGLGLWNP